MNVFMAYGSIVLLVAVIFFGTAMSCSLLERIAYRIEHPNENKKAG